MEKIYKIHPAAQEIIDKYLHMKIGASTLACPYYINVGHIKDLRAMVGKGSPEEIEMEVRIWAQLKGLDLEKISAADLKDFMRQRKIGIDCSGLVYHVYNAWTKASTKRSLINFVKFPNNSFLKRLKNRLRPAENLGADLLTNEMNAKKVSVNDLMPGDLIRSKGSATDTDHVLIVTTIAKEKGKTKWLEYVHSTQNFGKDNGVRQGRIEIVKDNNELKDQKWLEIDENGEPLTYNNFLKFYSDNGPRRPNFFDQLKQISD